MRFGTDVRDGLVRTVCEDIEPALSIVAGKAFEAGEAFGVARMSDFDIALAGQAILQRAQSIETGLMSGGTRTGPLSAKDLQFLGLKDLSSKMNAQAGCEVIFNICDSVATAASRAPSAVLPK